MSPRHQPRRRAGGPGDHPVAGPPWWAVVTAVTAPVAMIGGWTVAAAVQPAGFDPVRRTISDLATGAVAHPQVMTAGLLLTGVAHVGTALGLRAADGAGQRAADLPGRRAVAPAGRWMLALGGLGTAAVAALPVDTVPRAHAVAATVAFGALALWPAAGLRGRRGPDGTDRQTPVVLTRPAGLAATAVLTGLLAWFVLELRSPDGATTGLAERAVAGAQALWPCVVVLALRGAGDGGAGDGGAGDGGAGDAGRA